MSERLRGLFPCPVAAAVGEKKKRKTKFDLIFLASYFLPLSVSQMHTWSIGAEKQPFEEFGFKIAKV